MKAKVVATHPSGCVVKVNQKHADRYMTGCPFWTLLVPGKPGAQVEFAVGDIAACSPTQEQAERVYKRS